jgi:hypothetical protein
MSHGFLIEGENIQTFEKNLARGWFDQSQDGLACGRLSAPTLSNQSEGFPFSDQEGDAIDGPDRFLVRREKPFSIKVFS